MILFSICIPTRNREQIIVRTLNSIYVSNSDCSLFEVVIYDSSENDNLQQIIQRDFQYSNIKYVRGPNKGFYNLISALELGSGEFLKLHNDYSLFESEALSHCIEEIKKYIISKPLIFFPNGSLDKTQISSEPTFDLFLKNVSFYCTWSTAFGIWKDDFEQFKDIRLEKMFPHMSLLFACKDKKSYLIDNKSLFANQDVPNKGGYNLFHTFAVVFIDEILILRKTHVISRSTFRHIKMDLLFRFLSDWYFKTKLVKNEYQFDLSNIKKNIKIHFSYPEYYLMILNAWVKFLKSRLKSVIISCKNFH